MTRVTGRYGPHLPTVRRAYLHALDHLSTGIAVFDRAGHLLYFNRAFSSIFNSRPGEKISGNSLFLEMLNMSPASFHELLRSEQLDLSYQSAPCRNSSLFLTFRLRKMGKKFFLCEVRDTTAEKLRELSSGADDRLRSIGERTARAVHALKGSAGTLNLILDLLADSPDSFPRHVPSLFRVGRRVTEVISQVLRVAAEPEISFREVDLSALLAEIEQLPEIAQRLEQYHILFNLLSGGPSIIEGALSELRETLVYLIENAIEAVVEKGEAGGRISVALLQYSNSHGEEIEIRIEDTGIGIRPDNLASIFLPFFTTKREGSGLGLAMARKIVENMHGGRITVTSQPGEGTSFSVFLPVRPPKHLITQKPAGLPEKIQELRQRLTAAHGYYQGQIEECISSMTLEHLRETSVDDLFVQVEGQINRLQAFLERGEIHISVNNLSRRTEVVVAGPKDSLSRNYWEEIILYNLQKMGLGEQISAAGTRKVEKAGGVCRVFEIKKMRGKLEEEERRRLEANLIEKFTPLPALAELRAQEFFLKSAHALLPHIIQPGSIHSLIFNPSLRGDLRLVAYRIAAFPVLSPSVEDVVAKRFVLEHPPAGATLQSLVQWQRQQGGIYIFEGTANQNLLPMGIYLSALIAAFRIKSTLAAVFATSSGGEVMNFLCQGTENDFNPEVKETFLALNQAWEQIYR